jgi:hypothetical protein
MAKNGRKYLIIPPSVEKDLYLRRKIRPKVKTKIFLKDCDHIKRGSVLSERINTNKNNISTSKYRSRCPRTKTTGNIA